MARTLQRAADSCVRTLAGFDLWALAGVYVLYWFVCQTATSGSGRGFWAYAALGLMLGLSLLGATRPRLGALIALASLPLTSGPPLPHAITSSPSDYLIAGAAVGILVRWRLHGARPPILPVLLVIAVSGSAVASLAVNLLHDQTFIGVKVMLAEVVGLALASLYPLVIVVALGDERGGRDAMLALLLAGLVSAAVGIAGVPDILFCTIDASASPFVSPHLRLAGMAPDPNVFAVQLATLAACAAYFTQASAVPREMRLVVLALLPVLALLLLLSGSRTGVPSMAVVILGWALLSRMSLRVLPSLMSAAAVLLSIGFFWSHFPCPLGNAVEVVKFSERGNEAAYVMRVVKAQTGENVLVGNSASDDLVEEEFTKFREKLDKNNDSMQEGEGDGAALERAAPRWTWAETHILQGISFIAREIGLDATRELLWRHAASLWAASPWFGVGPANMAASTPRGWRAHNAVLTSLAELGMVGVLLIGGAATAVAAAVGRSAFQAARDQAALAFVVLGLAPVALGLATQDILRQPLVWGVVGTALLLHYRGLPSHGETESFPQRERRA